MTPAKPTPRRWLSWCAPILLTCFATSCGGSQGNASTDAAIDRSTVAAAFQSAEEPLTVRLDLAMSDPDSPVDVIFVPEDQDVEDPPYQVAVFETVGSANEHVDALEAANPSHINVLHVANVVVTASTSMSADRESRLDDALARLR